MVGSILCAAGVVVGVGLSGIGGAATRTSTHTSNRVASSAAGRAAEDNCQALVDNLHNPNNSSATLTVTGAYASTAGQVSSWDEARDDTGPTGSLFASDPSSEVVSVCFISGSLMSSTAGGQQPTSDYFGPGNGSYGAAVYVVLANGQALPDVLLGGSSVPYSPPPTTADVPAIHRDVA